MSQRQMLVAGTAIVALFISSAAAAQTAEAGPTLDEVVVVAQKKEERLQDVPVAVSVVQGESVARLGLSSFEQLSRYVPNLTVSEGASGNRITVRGISSGTNRGFEQSVGLFVDGVYAGRARQFSVPFFDLERVEVLKGPQGVLFGKNTVAGAVSLITRGPRDTPEAQVGGAYETRFGEVQTTAIVSGPLSDQFRARLALRYANADEGAIYNSLSNKRERGLEQALARASFVWDPTDSLKVSGKYEYSDSKTTGSIFQLIAFGASGPAFKAFDPRVENRLDLNQSSGVGQANVNAIRAHNAALRVDFDLGQTKLVSQTGYSAYKGTTRGEDSDFTPVPLLGYSSDEDFWQVSEELRLESAIGDAIDYTAGVYFQTGGFRSRPQNILTGAPVSFPSTRNLRDFDQESTSYSLFAEGAWRTTERLKLILGARYNVEDKDVHRSLTVLKMGSNAPEDNPAILAFSRNAFSAVNFDLRESRTERQLSPSVTVQFDVTPAIMAYAKATKGFKGGGFDASDTKGDAPPYEDEQVTAYEAGLKSSFGAAELNLSIFNAAFKDLQVQAFNGLTFQTANAGRARSRGVELDGRWKLSSEWLLSGSLAYLNAEYEDFKSASCTTAQTAARQAAGLPGPCTQDLSGRPLNDAPKWAGALNANYHRPLAGDWTLDANLGLNFRSAHYVAPDLDPLGRQAAYATWDANVELIAPANRWRVSLVGKNLGDERVKTYVVNVPLFTGAKAASINEPRTVQIRASVDF